MVRRVSLFAVLAISATLVLADTALARHRGGGGGGRHHRSRGGCSASCGGGCGASSCGGGCGAMAGGGGGAMVCGGGTMSYVSGSAVGGGMYIMPAAPGGTRKKTTRPRKSGGETEEEEGQTAAPASLMVTLPQGATLTVQGQAVPAVAGTQVFYSPDLERGQDYHYTLRVQITREGQTQEVTRRVTVRAGEQTEVNLAVPDVTAAVTE
jgi:uncharacterized protein (TIGR03000 family)